MTILVPSVRMQAGHEHSRCSSLVLRLIRAQDDPVKRRLRDYLLAQPDDRLKQSLGFSANDIHLLRESTSRRGMELSANFYAEVAERIKAKGQSTEPENGLSRIEDINARLARLERQYARLRGQGRK
ncbi:MAG: hypothetical protein WBX25_04320 [Rhodomicrobium sp.]